jgi:hypothetical protein
MASTIFASRLPTFSRRPWARAWAPRLWLAGARADRPAHDARQILRLYAATAVALTRWEDRLRLRRVGLVVGERPGSAQVVLDARRTDTASANALVRLSIPLTS